MFQESSTTVNSFFQLSKMHKPYTEFAPAAYSSFCNSVPCTVLNKPYTVFTLFAISNTYAKHLKKANSITPDFIFLTPACIVRIISEQSTAPYPENQLTRLNHKKRNEQQKRLHRKIVRAFLNICNYLQRGNFFSSGSLTYCFMKGATFK